MVFVSCLPQVPEGHRERMRLAEMSFFWHRVYDPRSRTCVHFCDAAPQLIGTAEVPALPSTAGGMSFLGCAVVPSALSIVSIDASEKEADFLSFYLHRSVPFSPSWLKQSDGTSSQTSRMIALIPPVFFVGLHQPSTIHYPVFSSCSSNRVCFLPVAPVSLFLATAYPTLLIVLCCCGPSPS